MRSKYCKETPNVSDVFLKEIYDYIVELRQISKYLLKFLQNVIFAKTEPMLFAFAKKHTQENNADY